MVSVGDFVEAVDECGHWAAAKVIEALDPPNPLARKFPPLVLSLRSRLRPLRNALAVQWPYHFSKPDDGPDINYFQYGKQQNV